MMMIVELMVDGTMEDMTADVVIIVYVMEVTIVEVMETMMKIIVVDMRSNDDYQKRNMYDADDGRGYNQFDEAVLV